MWQHYIMSIASLHLAPVEPFICIVNNGVRRIRGMELTAPHAEGHLL